jgi:hypothetical protein
MRCMPMYEAHAYEMYARVSHTPIRCTPIYEPHAYEMYAHV